MAAENIASFPDVIRRMESRVKYIAIPVLGSILGVVFKPKSCTTSFDYVFSILDSVLVVYSVWLLIRFIIIRSQRSWPDEPQNTKRLSYQFVLSSFAGFLVVWLNAVMVSLVFGKFSLFVEFSLSFKAILITMLTFVLMVNSVYENFYLLSKLNKATIAQEKYRKNSIAAELQNLKSKINPHFLFNTFNALSEITEEDPKRASMLIDELSDVYRYVLQAQDENWVLLADELEFARSYIELLKMRYESKLDVDIMIDNHFLNYKILPLSMQLLIENAIKHNEISKKNKLLIEVYLEEGMFLVVKNKKLPRKIMPSSTQTGLYNINQRYRHLAGEEISIDDGAGYFTVKLPIRNKLSAVAQSASL